MKGSGGTEGGFADFFIGLCLAGLAAYLFFDSVRMSSGSHGFVSGLLAGRGGVGGRWETTSMGIVFVPFAIGVFSLFVDASRKWAWWITYIGLGVVTLEILSRVRFLIEMKTSHFFLMLILFLFGCALMFKSYRETHTVSKNDKTE